jgi:hypothetical protein
MEQPDPHKITETRIADLVEALEDMRNALVKASMLLRDHQFENDALKRQAALDQAIALLNKINPR